MSIEKKYFKNSYHHLYNRGVNHQIVFFDRKDYLFFLKRLGQYKSSYHISILCYCLMPNHFHLFVKQLTDEYSIGKFIGVLTNSYTKATNSRYDRSGVLFEGPTKNQLIEESNHFIWMCKYILMNPVRANLVTRSHLWDYTCARDYLGLRNGKLPDMEEILSPFGSLEEFRSFVEGKDDGFDYSIFL